ncbi:MAG TPA: cupin domain-containing protein [Candidatus Paceibacterota bacterium]
MKSFLFTQDALQKLLQQEPGLPGKRHLDPLKSLHLSKEIPFGILEDINVQEPKPEVHRHEGDLWVCLQGKAEFICGGELIDPQEVPGYGGNEITGSAISNGETIILTPGDFLWIPTNEPHMHRNIGGSTARLMIIKIPAVKS